MLRCVLRSRPSSLLIPIADVIEAVELQTAGAQELKTSVAGQGRYQEEVNDDIWLVSFMDYDLGYFDLETRMLEPLDNPFGPRLSPM